MYVIHLTPASIIFLGIVALALLGCTAATPAPTFTPVPTSAPTPASTVVPTQTPTPTIASTATPAPTATPRPTPANTPQSTATPTRSGGGDSLNIDSTTTWQAVFDMATPARRSCITDALDARPESALATSIADSGIEEEWTMDILSCVEPVTARAIFLSAFISHADMVAGVLPNDEQMVCLEEWVSDKDVVAVLGVSDAEEIFSLYACVPEVLLSSYFGEYWNEAGLGADGIACIRQQLAETDIGWTRNWQRMIVGLMIVCVPDVMLEQLLWVSMAELSEDEAACLRDWISTIDVAAFLSVDGPVDSDPLASLGLPEVLTRCVPDR